MYITKISPWQVYQHPHHMRLMKQVQVPGKTVQSLGLLIMAYDQAIHDNNP